MASTRHSVESPLNQKNDLEHTGASEPTEMSLEARLDRLGLDDSKITADAVSEPAVHAAQAAYVDSLIQPQTSSIDDDLQRSGVAGDEPKQIILKHTMRKSPDSQQKMSLQDKLKYKLKGVLPNKHKDLSEQTETTPSDTTSNHRIYDEEMRKSSSNATRDTRKSSNHAESDHGRSSSDLPINPDTTTADTNEPVVHETVRVQNVEIEHELIDREIHEHHDIYRIQPLIEKVVKPARHFIMTEDDGEVEISADAAAELETFSIDPGAVAPEARDVAPT